MRGSRNGSHAGGGVEYWMRDGLGLRLEFRDHLTSDMSSHLWGARVGLTWAPGARVGRKERNGK